METLAEHGANGVVVSHPLSMREALHSIPSVSSLYCRMVLRCYINLHFTLGVPTTLSLSTSGGTMVFKSGNTPAEMTWNRFGFVCEEKKTSGGLPAFFPPSQNPANRNRTSDHLMAAAIYSQMLYQLSYSRLGGRLGRRLLEISQQCLRAEQNACIAFAPTNTSK
jgi:hypothetical protein